MNYDVEVVSADVRMRPKNSEVDRLLQRMSAQKICLTGPQHLAGCKVFEEVLRPQFLGSQTRKYETYAPTKYII